jgi:hypothetical protein
MHWAALVASVEDAGGGAVDDPFLGDDLVHVAVVVGAGYVFHDLQLEGPAMSLQRGLHFSRKRS